MSDIDKSKVSRFVVFCLESYKRKANLEGAATADIFESCGVVDYLTDGYDVLHSLGEVALVEDIADFIQRRT